MAIITSTPADYDNPPVSLDDVKLHLGITYSQDDERLKQKIWEVIDWLEMETGRSWAVQSYKWTIDRFPPVLPTYNEWLRTFAQSPIFQYGPWIPMRQRLDIPRPPLVSLDQVQYFDGTNTLQTLDPSQYIVLSSEVEWGLIEAVTSFPTTYIRPDAVQITFTAGPQTLPFLFHSWVLDAVSWKNENREGGDIPANLLRGIALLRDGTFK